MSVFARHHHYDGKRYEFVVTGQQQADCPKWDPEKDANPPVSAAKALSKANEFIETIRTKDPWSWELEGLALVDKDGWMWQVCYRLTKIGAMTGPPDQMDCWILMDGTIVQPRIREDTK